MGIEKLTVKSNHKDTKTLRTQRGIVEVVENVKIVKSSSTCNGFNDFPLVSLW